MRPIPFTERTVRDFLTKQQTTVHMPIKPTNSDSVIELHEGRLYEITGDGSRTQREPYYRAGEILYVIEDWCQAGSHYMYKADCQEDRKRWKSFATMPLDAARIFLKVTSDSRAEKQADGQGWTWAFDVQRIPKELAYQLQDEEDSLL